MNAENMKTIRDFESENPPKACIVSGNKATTHRHDDQEAGLTKIRTLP